MTERLIRVPKAYTLKDVESEIKKLQDLASSLSKVIHNEVSPDNDSVYLASDAIARSFSMINRLSITLEDIETFQEARESLSETTEEQ